MSGFRGFLGFPGSPPFPGMGGGGGRGGVDPLAGFQNDPIARQYPPGSALFPGMNNPDAPRFSGRPQPLQGQVPEDIKMPPSLGGGYGEGSRALGGVFPGQGGWGGIGGFPGGGGCQCPQCKASRV